VAEEHGEIARPLGRDPIRRVRMKAGGLAPREALTRYRVVKRYARFTLVEAQPRTGRTHQIRVHLASIGHPIVGDTLYGAPGKLRVRGREQKTLPRTFLHAAGLEFRHPRSGDLVSFESKLPAELENFLTRLAGEDL
jgi:23S rRNA pseudouridine1911/1915/1917 synthase